MRRQPWQLLLFLAVFLAPGCSAPIEIIDYRCGQPPQLSTAPIAETYTLMDDSTHLRIEATTFNFSDEIGFVLEGGELEAVAGDERIPLADGSYSWVIERPRFRFPSGAPSRSNRSNYHFTSARGALGALAAASVAAVIVGAVNAAP